MSKNIVLWSTIVVLFLGVIVLSVMVCSSLTVGYCMFAPVEGGSGWLYTAVSVGDKDSILPAGYAYEDTAFDLSSTPDVLPDELRYADINEDALRNYLDGRDSILADEPYFSAIVNTAKKFNINPLLMFAITEQEQGCVPRSHKNALKIANNPFNVYHSWQRYNTDIYDSAAIAARTIIDLSSGRPDAVHPIYWINTRGGRGGYAEDPHWWVGVSRIFEKLKSICM